jgi:hypothetical protein
MTIKGVGLVVVVLAVLISFLPIQAKTNSSVSYLSMTIVDSPDFTPNVISDGVENGTYTDHDHLGGDVCVSATLSSNGFIQIQQNYLSSTHPKDVWCNAAQAKGFAPRYWNMIVDDGAACTALFGSGSAPCTVVPQITSDLERVIPGSNAFASSSSQITFQFTLSGRGYSIQTDSPAAIAPGALNNTRTITYHGTAKLYQSATAISGSFPFEFQLVLAKL